MGHLVPFASIRSESCGTLETLRQRRQVVKTCSTPCVQTCYLRQESDSTSSLLKRAGSLVQGGFERKVWSKVQSWKPIPDGKLILEFSDVSHSDWEAIRRPHKRWIDLIRNIDEVPTAENWTRFRDEGLVDFGRGFMGFDELKRITASLERAKLQFETVSIGWRGDALLHPEIEPMLHHLVHWVHHGMFKRLEVHTSGMFLREEVASIAALDVPQRWVIDLDAGNGVGFQMLEAIVEVANSTHCKTNGDDWRDRAYVVSSRFAFWLGDAPPHEGDWLWFAHYGQRNFFKDKEGLERLESIAKRCGQPVTLHPEATL